MIIYWILKILIIITAVMVVILADSIERNKENDKNNIKDIGGDGNNS